VADLLDEYGSWKEAVVRTNFCAIDADMILKIRTSPRLDADFLAWQPEQNGVFTVRSAYRLGLAIQQQGHEGGTSSGAPQGDKPVWKKLWKCGVPEKVRIFAWKAVANGLATEDNKVRRGMKVSGRCRICNHEREDTKHALFQCPHAHALGEAMGRVWPVQSRCQAMSGCNNWLEEMILMSPMAVCAKILMIAWRAWYARNEVTHDKPLPSIEGSRRFLCSYLVSLENIRSLPTEDILKGKQPIWSPAAHAGVATEARPNLSTKEPAWERPRPGVVKLNVDGSFLERDGSAGAGMILRNADGGIIFSACRSLYHCNSALETEIGACMQGLALALQWSQDPVIVETDNSTLIRMAQGKERDGSSLGHLVAEVRNLCLERRVEFVKVSRSQNIASDALAKFGRVSDSSGVWFATGPDEIVDLILRDCNATDE
jgi:ribonuclease HI